VDIISEVDGFGQTRNAFSWIRLPSVFLSLVILLIAVGPVRNCEKAAAVLA
jgi:hypothetical protein